MVRPSGNSGGDTHCSELIATIPDAFQRPSHDTGVAAPSLRVVVVARQRDPPDVAGEVDHRDAAVDVERFEIPLGHGWVARVVQPLNAHLSERAAAEAGDRTGAERPLNLERQHRPLGREGEQVDAVDAGRDDLGEDVEPDVAEQQRRDRFGDEPGVDAESTAPFVERQRVEAVAPGAAKELVFAFAKALFDVFARQRQVNSGVNGRARREQRSVVRGGRSSIFGHQRGAGADGSAR